MPNDFEAVLTSGGGSHACGPSAAKRARVDLSDASENAYNQAWRPSASVACGATFQPPRTPMTAWDLGILPPTTHTGHGGFPPRAYPIESFPMHRGFLQVSGAAAAPPIPRLMGGHHQYHPTHAMYRDLREVLEITEQPTERGRFRCVFPIRATPFPHLSSSPNRKPPLKPLFGQKCPLLIWVFLRC